MIAGLAAAADLISSWSEEEDAEEEEGSQLRRMRDRLAQNIEVLIAFEVLKELHEISAVLYLINNREIQILL